MRIPRNKQNRIVNKEYSRLPYWTDEGYEDIQKQTSQKYIQDTYGAFAESENQLPYLSDADYQGLEYQYQNPEFFDPTDLPDVDFTDTAPKGTCYQLWLSLFGDATGAFIPTASEWNKLNEYAKKCPLIYMPHICCLNMKITGPDSVAPGETVEYSVSGGGHGCAYDIDAKRGEFIGYKYTAPTTPGSDRLSIKPWMSDDQHTICAYKDILIEGGCKGTVHATTPQMQVGASQTLYITGGNEADTYYWSTTTGSLSASEGTSVTYTAPATNANCTSNPTITVTCGGSTIGTLTIAVRANSFDYNKAAYYITQGGGPGTPIGDPANPALILRDCEYRIHLVPVRCDGSIPRTWSMPTCGYDYANPHTGTCPHCAVLKYDPPGCWGNWAFDRVTDMEHAEAMCASAAPKNTTSPSYYGIPCNCAIGAVYDVRTAQQKADGCCPAGLL